MAAVLHGCSSGGFPRAAPTEPRSPPPEQRRTFEPSSKRRKRRFAPSPSKAATDLDLQGISAKLAEASHSPKRLSQVGHHVRRATCATRHAFDRVCDEHGIEHRRILPYHPWTIHLEPDDDICRQGDGSTVFPVVEGAGVVERLVVTHLGPHQQRAEL